MFTITALQCINRSYRKCLHTLIFIFFISLTANLNSYFFFTGICLLCSKCVNSCVNCTLLGRGLLSNHFSLVGKWPHISSFIFIPSDLFLCSFSWVSVPPIVLTTLMCKHSWCWSAFWKQYCCNLFQIFFTLPNKWHLQVHSKLHVKGKSNSPTHIFFEKANYFKHNPFLNWLSWDISWLTHSAP